MRYLLAVLLVFLISGPMASADMAQAESLFKQGDWAGAAQQLRSMPKQPPDIQQRAVMLAAEIALARGEPKQASVLFEKAATQFGESAAAEVGMVRAYLQAGEFRQAIALANLTSGEHPESTEALAWLIYLEDRAGHTDKCLAKLREARKSAPDDVALLGAEAEILIDRGAAKPAIAALDEWMRRNPAQGDILALRGRAAIAAGDEADALRWRVRAASAYAAVGESASANELRDWIESLPQPLRDSAAVTPELPAAAAPPAKPQTRWRTTHFEPIALAKGTPTVVGNGFVIDGGKRIVTHLRVIDGSQGEVIIRNGLGRVRKARVESRDAASGLAVLRLTTPYTSGWSLTRQQLLGAAPGKFCFSVGFAMADTQGAVFPSLNPGIVVRPEMPVGLFQLTSPMTAASSGSAVFSDTGQLIGIALGKDDAIPGVQNRHVALGDGNLAVRAGVLKSMLDKPVRNQRQQNAAKAPIGTNSAEELYERILPAVVLVVARH